MQIVYLGELFARGAMYRLPSFCRSCFWSLGRVSDTPPNWKVIIVPFLWIIPEKGSYMCFTISVGWDYLGVVYALEQLIYMYQILGYTRYLLYTVYYSSHDVMCKTELLKLYEPKCFTCFVKNNTLCSAFSITTKGLLSLQYHSISPPRTA